MAYGQFDPFTWYSADQAVNEPTTWQLNLALVGLVFQKQYIFNQIMPFPIWKLSFFFTTMVDDHMQIPDEKYTTKVQIFATNSQTQKISFLGQKLSEKNYRL